MHLRAESAHAWRRLGYQKLAVSLFRPSEHKNAPEPEDPSARVNINVNGSENQAMNHERNLEFSKGGDAYCSQITQKIPCPCGPFLLCSNFLCMFCKLLGSAATGLVVIAVYARWPVGVVAEQLRTTLPSDHDDSWTSPARPSAAARHGPATHASWQHDAP